MKYLKEFNANPEHFYTIIAEDGTIDYWSGLEWGIDERLQHMYEKMLKNGCSKEELRIHYLDVLRDRIIGILFGQPELFEYIVDWLISEYLTAYSQKKVFQSEKSGIFFDCRKVAAVKTMIAIDWDYYQKFKPLFCRNAREKYNCLMGCAFQVIFEKWESVCTNGLYVSKYDDIMTPHALLQLTAQDLTMGNMLPNYEVFNKISELRNESAVSTGSIGFVGDEFRMDVSCLGFHFLDLPEIIPPNARYIRKLLEMTGASGVPREKLGNQYILVSNGKKILGMTQRKNCAKSYIVDFYGLMNWQLSYQEKEIFSYCEDRYFYRTPNYDSSLETIRHFLNQTEYDNHFFEHLIENALKQRHGTMLLLFSNPEDAEAEAERFISFKRGIRFQNPQPLRDPLLLLSLSSIDGAILIDGDINCYGFGVIVDGEACVKGTPSRGARYNSANNYIHWCDAHCLAIVISEDGTIDVIEKNCK